jgi:hypothetical protein
VYYVAAHIGQPKIAPGLDGRVQVVEMHIILDRVVALVVRGTVQQAGFDASARHPHRERFRIMIPPIGSLCGRCPSELTTPKHERVLSADPAPSDRTAGPPSAGPLRVRFVNGRAKGLRECVATTIFELFGSSATARC